MLYSGFIIRKKRLEKNWSQEGLCRGICAVSYLSKIEKGKVEASDEIISALFEKLGAGWVTDEKILSEGKEFVEDWYEAAFSADWDRHSAFLEKFRRKFSALENSPFMIDVLLLEKFGEEKTSAIEEKFESYMNPRQLSVQRLLSGNYAEAIKLFPCSYMLFRAGVSEYVKGENAIALENLQKAYDLAAGEGRARVMLFAKLFTINCYSNMCDIDSMEHHGKIAKRLAFELGEPDFISTIDYNFAATKIETGDYAGAYEYFSKLREPRAQSLHKLAVCCEELGKREEAFAVLEREKTAKDENEEQKYIADKACELVKFRLEHEDYLGSPEYGKMLLDFFELCREKMPIGYAKFHLPWVLRWYAANRQYKQAFELLKDFPQIQR